MHKNDLHLNLLRSYFILSLVGSLIGLIAVTRAFSLGRSTTPVDATWAGYSWALALAGFFVVLFLCLTILAFQRSTTTRLLRFVDRYFRKGPAWVWAFLVLLFVFILGLIFAMSASPNLYGPVYPLSWVPFFIWLAWSSGLALIFLVIMRFGFSFPVLLYISLVLAIVVFGVGVSLQFWSYDSPRQEDIYFTYLDGERLLQGVNPYERVLAGDMRVNDKYSTYLPGFYYLSWVIQKAGLRAFAEWLSFWRVIFLLFNLSIAALLFYIPARKNLVVLSLFATLFWLFNRWTLHVARTADIDFIALFFMLLSLYVYQKNRRISFLLLGLSLTVKQVAIFLVPVYLIWSWKDSSGGRIKDLFSAAFWISAVPLIASLPFFIWNGEAFVRSILFSTTRVAAAAFNVYSLDVALGWQGILARTPVLVMFMLVYWLSWKYILSPFSLALLVLAVFVFFNSVFYTSYMVWVVALIPLTAYEILTRSGTEIRELPA